MNWFLLTEFFILTSLSLQVNCDPKYLYQRPSTTDSPTTQIPLPLSTHPASSRTTDGHVAQIPVPSSPYSASSPTTGGHITQIPDPSSPYSASSPTTDGDANQIPIPSSRYKATSPISHSHTTQLPLPPSLLSASYHTSPFTTAATSTLDPRQQEGFTQQAVDSTYIKNELKDLIRMSMDLDKDGQVSYEELRNYLAKLHEKQVEDDVNKQWNFYQPQIHEVFSWEGYEPERKEVLTWDNYFNRTYPQLMGYDVGIPIHREQDTSRFTTHETEPHATTTGESSPVDGQSYTNQAPPLDDEQLKKLKLMVKRADARWKLADENGDTLLTKQEFKYLIHPDEGNEEQKNLFIKESTEDMNLGQDVRVSFAEFMRHLKTLAHEEDANHPDWLASQKHNFDRFLDKNGDGVLDFDEIKTWLVPVKQTKFSLDAKRLFDIGDTNRDNKLSVVEIVDHHEQFLVLLPPEYWNQEHPELQIEGTHLDEQPTTTDRDEL